MTLQNGQGVMVPRASNMDDLGIPSGDDFFVGRDD